MPIELVPINHENWRKAVNLKVADHQDHWVAPNWYSIIEASFESGPYVNSMAIMDGPTMVGFTLFGRFSKDPAGEYWIDRLMIDTAYQRQGYGRAAMEAITQHIHAQPDVQAICISIVPDNQPARALYESLGFVHEGRIVEGELVFVYKGG